MQNIWEEKVDEKRVEIEDGSIIVQNDYLISPLSFSFQNIHSGESMETTLDLPN